MPQSKGEKTLAYIESNNANSAKKDNGESNAESVCKANTKQATPPNTADSSPNRYGLFCHANYQCEREITITHFERIVREGVSIDDHENILKQDIKIWTWARLCEKAENLGISPADIVRTCRLDR